MWQAQRVYLNTKEVTLFSGWYHAFLHYVLLIISVEVVEEKEKRATVLFYLKRKRRFYDLVDISGMYTSSLSQFIANNRRLTFFHTDLVNHSNHVANIFLSTNCWTDALISPLSNRFKKFSGIFDFLLKFLPKDYWEKDA